MIVTLSAEHQAAARVAARSQVESAVRLGRGHHNGPNGAEGNYDQVLDGFGAEIGAGQAIGVEWVYHGNAPWYGGDLIDIDGRIIEVRYRHRREMLIYPEDDKLDRFYFAATGRFPTYDVYGWLPGWMALARSRERPAHWTGRLNRIVAADLLRPVETWKPAASQFVAPAIRPPRGRETGDGWDPSRNTSKVKLAPPGSWQSAVEACQQLAVDDPALVKWILDGHPTLTEAEHVARFGKPYDRRK